MLMQKLKKYILKIKNILLKLIEKIMKNPKIILIVFLALININIISNNNENIEYAIKRVT